MRTGIALGLLLAVASIAAAQQPAETPGAPLPSVQLPPELARVLTDYEAGWRAGDGAALARLFAEDGFVLPNGAPPVRGRAAIQRYYKGPGGPLALRAFAFGRDVVSYGLSRDNGFRCRPDSPAVFSTTSFRLRGFTRAATTPGRSFLIVSTSSSLATFPMSEARLWSSAGRTVGSTRPLARMRFHWVSMATISPLCLSKMQW